jgi:hypothetical protein
MIRLSKLDIPHAAQSLGLLDFLLLRAGRELAWPRRMPRPVACSEGAR